MNNFRLLAGLALAAVLSAPAMAQGTASQTLTLTINSGALSISGGGSTSAFNALNAGALGTGVNPLVLTNPPSFVISDLRGGASNGWNVSLQTSTTAAPAGQSLPGQQLHYFVGAGGNALLSDPGTFVGNVEGFPGGGGTSGAAGITPGDQNTNAAPVKVISANANVANTGSRTYTVGPNWGLQNTAGTPVAGSYTWNLTATLNENP